MRVYFVALLMIALGIISIIHSIANGSSFSIVAIPLNGIGIILWVLIIAKYYKRTVGMVKLDPGQTALFPSVLIDYEKGKRFAYIIILFKRAYIIDYKRR